MSKYPNIDYVPVLVFIHNDVSSFNSFGLVKSYNMPCIVESASLEPKYGNKFIAGGEDMWVRVFDFHTGAEIGEFPYAVHRQYFFTSSII